MQVGYIRISTVGQNTARQEVLMQELGVEKVFIDRMSGKNTNRPELQKMMDYVRKVDPKAFVTVYSVNEVRYQPKK